MFPSAMFQDGLGVMFMSTAEPVDSPIDRCQRSCEMLRRRHPGDQKDMVRGAGEADARVGRRRRGRAWRGRGCIMRMLSCWMGFGTGWLRAKERGVSWRCGRRPSDFHDDGRPPCKSQRRTLERKPRCRAPVPPAAIFDSTGFHAAPLPNRQPAGRPRAGEACGGGVAGGRAGAAI
jgi:hypothetical protein